MKFVLVSLAVLAAASCAVAQDSWVSRDLFSPRAGHAVVTDTVRGRHVLFGGVDNSSKADTWEWAQGRWTRCPTTTQPSPRSRHAMAFDAARGVTVLFGGSGGSNRQGDTWEWDGVEWTQLSPPISPAPRSDHTMTYDAARGRVVLFGGRATFGAETFETWEWDGTFWVDRTAASPTRPGPRHGMQLVYDPVRQVSVLFGGALGFAETDETWEWDGNTWVQRSPSNAPPPRVGHRMVYDPNRQAVVLFGGLTSTGSTLLDDVWLWDGFDWTELQADGAAPAARYWHGLVVDGTDLLVFGGADTPLIGALSDTWAFDGVLWTQLQANSTPRATASTAMAYDAARSETVLFGGHNGVLSNRDTWVWDGEAWEQRQPATVPPTHYYHAMAYDTARQRTVMFGGSQGGGTWEWDGADWHDVTPAGPSPTSADSAAMAYDEARGEVVLFGGLSLNEPGSTWVWDGTNWTEKVLATVPADRAGHAMVYDPVRGVIVMFGGWNLFNSYFPGTWEWDGTSWTKRNPVTSPAARRGHVMVFDPDRGTVILHGGSDGVPGPRTDLWEWDGTNWSQLSSANSPDRLDHRAVFDAARGEVMTFGGISSTYRADTMTYGPSVPASARSFGTACAGPETPVLAAFGKPVLGRGGFALDVVRASGSQGGAVVLSGTSSPVPIGGCTFYLQPLLVSVPVVTNASGFASLALPIPDSPSLEGGTVFAQALVVDPQAPFAQIAFTGAIELVLGR